MINLRVAFLLPALIASLEPSAAARFGPPYNTDDPVPVDYLHWEIYLASQYLHTQGNVGGTGPHFEFNYGAAPNLQLHVIAPFAYNQESAGPSRWGYGDTELGVKYRFIQESKRGPQVGIFPLVELPTGNHSLGLGNGQAQFFLPVWLQKSWGDWSSYGGGGYWHNPGAGNRDYWFFGLQAQRQVSKPLSIGAEVFYRTASTVGGNNTTGFNVGGVWDFDEGHHFLFSAGSDVHGNSLGQFYVAYQWTFGPHEKKDK